MRIGGIVSGACLVVSALAVCKAKRYAGANCLTQEDAQQVADNFQNLISEYSDAIADASTTPEYTYYCDSTAELINSGCTTPKPLGHAVFDSRAALKAGQSVQPITRFQILRMWHSCTEVFVSWTVTMEPQHVRGVTVIETMRAPQGSPYPWLMNKVFSEHNSGAWMVGLGMFTPDCTSNATAGRG